MEKMHKTEENGYRYGVFFLQVIKRMFADCMKT